MLKQLEIEFEFKSGMKKELPGQFLSLAVLKYGKRAAAKPVAANTPIPEDVADRIAKKTIAMLDKANLVAREFEKTKAIKTAMLAAETLDRATKTVDRLIAAERAQMRRVDALARLSRTGGIIGRGLESVGRPLPPRLGELVAGGPLGNI